MKDSAQPPCPKDAVTVVHWERKSGDEPVIKFVIFGVLGLLLGLLLMVFSPAFRSIGALALFTVVFAGLLTIPVIAAQRKFIRGIAKRVNDTIDEVTGSSRCGLSVKQLNRIIRSGESWPIAVSGVPGLRLQVQRVLARDEDAPARWRAVITAVHPRNGMSSFDRLLEAALSGGQGTSAHSRRVEGAPSVGGSRQSNRG
ncbi:hypothetical protein [Arthrobacter sp. YN]|uniref:hypothetical protein n=1 Tax=Arthrobacter sp. YN TaxID=2020486 RepID=UPI000B6061AA|nr:hypothetical protein [Arthrobacter sp. YN]ASN22029.1 hypothetical protein CGK93_21955 [Arthrobacter sp. YN]